MRTAIDDVRDFLAQHCRDSWTVRTLARRTHRSQSAVRAALASLIKEDLIVREMDLHISGQTAYFYSWLDSGTEP
jgi:predicted transcriptional regulator